MNSKMFAAIFCFCFFPVLATAETGDPISLETNLIDIPTAEVLDRYQAAFITRAYEHGTVMETIDFGVYPRINLGIRFGTCVKPGLFSQMENIRRQPLSARHCYRLRRPPLRIWL